MATKRTASADLCGGQARKGYHAIDGEAARRLHTAPPSPPHSPAMAANSVRWAVGVTAAREGASPNPTLVICPTAPARIDRAPYTVLLAGSRQLPAVAEFCLLARPAKANPRSRPIRAGDKSLGNPARDSSTTACWQSEARAHLCGAAGVHAAPVVVRPSPRRAAAPIQPHRSRARRPAPCLRTGAGDDTEIDHTQN
jgi:hypothetical protein